MTITDNEKTDRTDEAPTGAADAAGAVPDELIDAVLDNVDAGGVELLGPDGVLADLTKRILERGLSEELTDQSATSPATRPGEGRATTATAPRRRRC